MQSTGSCHHMSLTLACVTLETIRDSVSFEQVSVVRTKMNLNSTQQSNWTHINGKTSWSDFNLSDCIKLYYKGEQVVKAQKPLTKIWTDRMRKKAQSVVVDSGVYREGAVPTWGPIIKKTYLSVLHRDNVGWSALMRAKPTLRAHLSGPKVCSGALFSAKLALKCPPFGSQNTC